MSLDLSEFVIELGIPPSKVIQLSLSPWASWDKIDQLFGCFLSWCPNFKLVIRAGRLYNCDEFRAKAKEGFPLMARRDRIQFETSYAVEED